MFKTCTCSSESTAESNVDKFNTYLERKLKTGPMHADMAHVVMNVIIGVMFSVTVEFGDWKATANVDKMGTKMDFPDIQEYTSVNSAFKDISIRNVALVWMADEQINHAVSEEHLSRQTFKCTSRDDNGRLTAIFDETIRRVKIPNLRGKNQLCGQQNECFRQTWKVEYKFFYVDKAYLHTMLGASLHKYCMNSSYTLDTLDRTSLELFRQNYVPTHVLMMESKTKAQHFDDAESNGQILSAPITLVQKFNVNAVYIHPSPVLLNFWRQETPMALHLDLSYAFGSFRSHPSDRNRGGLKTCTFLVVSDFFVFKPVFML